MQIVYLDLCCYNRPFDDQRQTRVQMETQAKLHLQQLAKIGQVQLIWSYVLSYENSHNPFPSRRESIQLWRDISQKHIEGTDAILATGLQIERDYALKSFDAMHVACAISGGAHMFVTTDDVILRKMKHAAVMQVVSPIEALSILENWYEN